MTNLNVQGVNEKELKTILETGHGLCNGKKGMYRDKARNVFAVLFATDTKNPTKNHVLQALKAAKKCELTLDGTPIAKEKIKISTYEAIKEGKMVAESVKWNPANLMLSVVATTV